MQRAAEPAQHHARRVDHDAVVDLVDVDFLALILDEWDHAHGATLFDDEPLVDAVLVEVVLAGQKLDSLRLRDVIATNCAIVNLYL